MKDIIIVRGGGDIATGTINRLFKAGFLVLVLETNNPTAIRRQVSLCEAIYQKEITVEDVTGVYVKDIEEIYKVWNEEKVPILIDTKGNSISQIKPDIVVDAILAKKNLGTTKDMAPLTIALGPEFCAGKDVDIVIETKRGHNLGRIITKGEAIKNTGIPGDIKGYSFQRVIHSPASGIINHVKKIGDIVQQGEVIAYIETENKTVEVLATIDGILRGLIRDKFNVNKGLKIADIDPRKEEINNCFTISDKSRCIAGSVLEVVCKYFNEKRG